MSTRNGFTLVEILIVVIILGILAAIAIPQFSAASDDARVSTLASDLQSVRDQLELYKFRHGGGYPDDVVAALTDSDGAFGPYMMKFPTNPFVTANGNQVDTTTLGGSTCGWFYDKTNGIFKPDDDAHTGL
ncbi:MAG: prepilin-type N-terminal cleavage/methylation domain-containing protein [Planctomycetota bacterium]|nr:prepilin-type N-terminal cleavage/methylation domain-containing protein [Planctomycetota bacterium]